MGYSGQNHHTQVCPTQNVVLPTHYFVMYLESSSNIQKIMYMIWSLLNVPASTEGMGGQRLRVGVGISISQLLAIRLGTHGRYAWTPQGPERANAGGLNV